MTTPSPLRRIPAVDEVLRRAEVAALADRVSPVLLAIWARELLEKIRRDVLAGGMEPADLETRLRGLAGAIASRAEAFDRAPLKRVLNATGVIVHTNLGRAPLAPGALDAMTAAGTGYTNLEYDLARGERGSRRAHLAEAAAGLFPGRGLLAVNNNAAAVLLALNTLAEGREAILSRGELVEIGGSFRIPDVMKKAGVTLREVGTTNRTRIEDYRAAVTERTAVVVKVHTSNYRIVGFVEEAPLASLAALAREKRIPLLVDQGSGSLLPESETALDGESSAADLLGSGADLVTFSGDKLLGGPQAGLIVGDPELVTRCSKNPLARAVRCDKTTLAALAWTLAEHAAGRARRSVPVLEMLFRSAASIGERAEALARGLARSGARAEWSVEDGASRVGGGAAPLQDVPTRLLAIRPTGRSASSCESALRSCDPPVIVRIDEERLLVDLRTVAPEEDSLIERALIQTLG